MKLARDVRAAMGPELRSKVPRYSEEAATLVESLEVVILMIR